MNYKKFQSINNVTSLGFLGLIRIFRDILFSSCILNTGSIIRWPFYIRKFGNLKIGKDFRSGPGIVIDILNKDAVLQIGHSFRAASRLHIGCISKVIIGDNVLIASDVYISDHSHGCYKGPIQSAAESSVNERELFSAPIHISDNVWIGEKVCIFPGVNIGENSIIGALSVVNSDILPNSMYVGCPARRIKMFDHVSNSWISIKD
jgi:lipopolysaccharide O-acetyltransferase